MRPLLILLLLTGISGLTPMLRTRLRRLLYGNNRRIPWLMIPAQGFLLIACLVALI